MAPGRGGEAEGSEDPLPSPCTPPTRVVVEQEEPDAVKTNLCCLQGCLATSAVAFTFLVALPTGILLLVWSQNSKDVAMLAVGGVLVTLPVITLVLLVIGCLNQRRILNCHKGNRVKCLKRDNESEAGSTEEKYVEKY